jgi:hypothetical protein
MQLSANDPVGFLMLHTHGWHEVVAPEEWDRAYKDTLQAQVPIFTYTKMEEIKQAIVRMNQYAIATAPNKLQHLRPAG